MVPTVVDNLPGDFLLLTILEFVIKYIAEGFYLE